MKWGAVRTKSPCTRCDVQVESGLGIGKVEAADLPDGLQAVTQGASMDGQALGRTVIVAAVVQVLGQGLHQVRPRVSSAR